MKGIRYEIPKALDRLIGVFPKIAEELRGKSVVDFGCGYGYQLVALTLAGASRVLGIDADEGSITEARKIIARHGLEGRVQVQRELPPDRQWDAFISQNSFEHFLEPQAILARLAAVLAPAGRIYITFSPPWYAPWGAHMAFFCRIPWVQLLFSERTIMNVRSLYRSDGAQTYRDVGLARMSVGKFEGVLRQSELRVIYRRYDCVRGLAPLRHLPWLRELFINRVSCILTH